MTTKEKHRAVVTLPSDRAIKITRVFNAPRRLVFEASTKPELVKKWWGPRGMDLDVCEIDLRPGGAWRYAKTLPDGSEFAFFGVYQEVTPPERVVYTESYDVPEIRDRPRTVTATYEERDGKTYLTIDLIHQTKEDRDAVIASGMEGGMQEAMERLDELLASL